MGVDADGVCAMDDVSNLPLVQARRMRMLAGDPEVSTVAESEDCDRVGCMVFHGKCKHNHEMRPLSQPVFPGSKVHLQNLHGYCPGCQRDTIMKHRSYMESDHEVEWTFRFLVWGGEEYEQKTSSSSQKRLNFAECFPEEQEDAVFEFAEFSVTNIS